MVSSNPTKSRKFESKSNIFTKTSNYVFFFLKTFVTAYQVQSEAGDFHHHGQEAEAVAPTSTLTWNFGQHAENFGYPAQCSLARGFGYHGQKTEAVVVLVWRRYYNYTKPKFVLKYLPIR